MGSWDKQIASLGADFQRAVQQGNVMRAEAAARQLGQLSLDHALRLLFLYAAKEPVKYERAALRWLGRYATEGKAVSLLKTQLRSRRLQSFERVSVRPRRSSSRSWCGVEHVPVPYQGSPPIPRPPTAR
jgi:hypothetical protein